MQSQLIHGECLAEMAKLEDNKVNLTVTSPPYDDLRTYNGFSFDFEPIARELFRVTKSGGVVVWIVADATKKGSETGTSFRQALYFMQCGFYLHDTMIWRKPNPMPRTHNRYEQAFEYMFILSKGRPNVWNPLLDECKLAGFKRSGTTQQTSNGVRTAKHKDGLYASHKQRENVWTLVNAERQEHPAVFPLQLAQDHVVSWSNVGDLVMDPFLGSGTTGVSCMNLDRNFIGIEQDEAYFAIASKRIADAKEVADGLRT